MNIGEHLTITGTALRRWIVAQFYDALCVGGLWLVGLLILHVPLAPLWAILGAMFQMIPVFGIMLSLIGPAVTGAISGGLLRMAYVLILYAVIVMLDGFVLQPVLMRRSARVPVWASIVVPFAMGSLFSFWGVVLSVPLLAVIYAYRERLRKKRGRSKGPS